MTYQRFTFEHGRDFVFDHEFLIREGLFDQPPFSLAMTGEQVAGLTWKQRERRVLHLQNMADLLFYQAGRFARNHAGPRAVVAVAGMLSGGNDSTATVYAMRRHLTHLVQADTGVCLAPTRQFVHQVAADLGLPLLVPRSPAPDDSYEHRVLTYGFPGPALHDETMNRLKERAWREARRQLVADGRAQRIIQVAGRRRSESARRTNVPEMQREYSVVWVSPMILWTKPDLNTFRAMSDVPRNEVYDLLHYSGECLCGCNAVTGEREWLFEWFGADPAVQLIRRLESQLAGREDIPPKRRIWGCGGASKRCMADCVKGLCNT